MARLFGDDTQLTAPATRDCITCKLPLTATRLKAAPDAVQCVKCVCLNGDEPKVKGRMVYTHKTAPDIEIGTRLAAEPPREHGFGPTIRLAGYKRTQDTSTRPLPFDGPIAVGARAAREPEREIVSIVNRHPARCHPERPRIGPSGLCLDCATAQQAQRVRVFPKVRHG